MRTDIFVARANIDHYLGLLHADELASDRRPMVIRLLISEEDKLGHDLEQLQFAESRVAKGRRRLSHLRQALDEAGPDGRALAESVIATVEVTQLLLENYCQRLRARANARL